jgi:BirA family transcriptional regulator, biotin operon repressor / biotin---[acetyl-CoA-carboxylase] ligase
VSGERNEVEWVVVGIGVNVNTEYSELPVALRRTATSLKMTTGDAVDRSELLSHLLVSLEKHYADVVDKGFDRALQIFRDRDYLMKRTISVQTHEGPVTGQASGIDECGALLVEVGPRQIRRFHSGDVSLHR